MSQVRVAFLVAERIRMMMKEKGLNKKQVMEKSRLSLTRFNQVINPTLDGTSQIGAVERIARALEADINALFHVPEHMLLSGSTTENYASAVLESASDRQTVRIKPSAEEDSAIAVAMEFPCKGTPQTWRLTQLQLDEWQALYPGLDLAQECREAKAWLIGNAKNQKTAKGMPRFLNGWFARANDNPRRRTANQQAEASPAPAEKRYGFFDIDKQKRQPVTGKTSMAQPDEFPIVNDDEGSFLDDELPAESVTDLPPDDAPPDTGWQPDGADF